MLQVFLYVGRLSKNGEVEQIRETGFTVQQARRLERMSIVELHELASLCSAAGVRLTANEDMIEKLFDTHDRHSKEKQLIFEMIKAGASFNNMSLLFGLSKCDFIEKRKALNMSGEDTGRFEQPDEPTEALIWGLWCRNKKIDVRDRLLKVHKATGVKIRVIWDFLNKGQEAVV
jgi:hypothetical protein